MPKSAYIHIPFCRSKCKYCSFVSFTSETYMNDYISALVKEIKNFYKGEKLNTLYCGGGTPSLVPVEFWKQIINLFSLNDNSEVTIEVNPDSVNFEYLKHLRDIGFNRISIGSQTFNDRILKLIGRRHNSEQIENAVDNSKLAGFKNISLDLIYGLPEQTIDDLKLDIEKFLSLGIQHISTYGLKIEENSYFGKHLPECLPDDDLQADMYILINNILEKNGFKRYEISNFAKPEYESRHNLNYWDNNEYYGFGVAAHGYVNGIRYSNSCSLEEYIKNPLKKENEKVLTQKEQLEEEIFLGFRKREGINTAKIKNLFGINFSSKYSNIISEYQEFIETTPQGYTLTLNGVLLSNIILAEFLEG